LTRTVLTEATSLQAAAAARCISLPEHEPLDERIHAIAFVARTGLAAAIATTRYNLALNWPTLGLQHGIHFTLDLGCLGCCQTRNQTRHNRRDCKPVHGIPSPRFWSIPTEVISVELRFDRERRIL
jgi:hypothetical protein